MEARALLREELTLNRGFSCARRRDCSKLKLNCFSTFASFSTKLLTSETKTRLWQYLCIVEADDIKRFSKTVICEDEKGKASEHKQVPTTQIGVLKRADVPRNLFSSALCSTQKVVTTCLAPLSATRNLTVRDTVLATR